ncbi:benzoate transporter [Sinorhizobium medicae]|nr:benzoate transporter [Sinorhizobium medicae]
MPNKKETAAFLRLSAKRQRIQSGGEPYRVFYAFDPRRTAILLVGGNKTGDDRFYEIMIPVADRLYDNYLIEIGKEGLI